MLVEILHFLCCCFFLTLDKHLRIGRKRRENKVAKNSPDAEKSLNLSLLRTRCGSHCVFMKNDQGLKQDPPLIWVFWTFWSFLTFLHRGIEKVERHLLWKYHKKIQRKSWSNVPPKLGACIRFLYKVVHKIGRLRKFNRSREIEFNFFTAWTIFMKLGTLVHHVYGYKTLPQIF